MAAALKIEEERIKQSRSLAELFVNPKTKSVYQRGDVIRFIKYGNTLKNISENGYELFYRGQLTPIIVDEINKNGDLTNLEQGETME